jgi:heme exporter protein CcmD
MNTDYFIIAAYAITAALIFALCASTWLGARRTRQQLGDREQQ